MSGGGVTVYPEEGEAFQVDCGGADAYFSEMDDFINCVYGGRESAVNPPESAMRSLELVLAERTSVETEQTVRLWKSCRIANKQLKSGAKCIIMYCNGCI
jgi:predicted dehydrogenase